MLLDSLSERVRLRVLVGPVLVLVMVGSAQASAAQGAAPRLSPAIDCRIAEVGAAQFARPTIEIPAGDGNIWEVLGRERFMAGDVKGALDAWNQIGQPRVRCVNVDGVVRTRRSAVIRYADIAAGDLFTAETFARLERRLDELPIASRSRVRYDPIDSGSAIVTPIVAERKLIPQGPQDWAVVGVHAAFVQEIRVNVSGPTGRGEVWSPSYRWSGNRPRAMLRLDAPAPGRLPGIVRFQTFLESQTYRYPALGDTVFRQPRQRVGAALSDWGTSWLRWEGGAAFDRIDTSPYLALEGSLNARALGDRFAVILTAGRWSGSGERASFTNGELVATVRSTTKQDVPLLTTLVGVARAADTAPLAIWPGAGSGEGRNALLRAHPLRRDSIITGEAFGRELVFTTTEYEYPFHTRVGTVGVVGFIDAVRASRRLDPASSPVHVDVGTGVRFGASGTGKVRLDIGYGVRDGRVRLSAGYVVPWGRR